MKVPFFDLKTQYKSIESEILNSINTVCENSDFTNGNAVKTFEESFAKFCSTKYAIALNNGTSALHLAMVALGIGKGDEVIIPANTFIATAWAPNYVGAKTVFVDCDPNTWQICISDIEKKIISILDSKIRPAVARDGGDIKFQEFKDGKVKVLLKGSCSGCPSSTLTLKKGVENLLCHYIPEVKEVLAV